MEEEHITQSCGVGGGQEGLLGGGDLRDAVWGDACGGEHSNQCTYIYVFVPKPKVKII